MKRHEGKFRLGRRDTHMKTLISALYFLAIVSCIFAADTNSVSFKDIAGDYYFGDGQVA